MLDSSHCSSLIDKSIVSKKEPFLPYSFSFKSYKNVRIKSSKTPETKSQTFVVLVQFLYQPFQISMTSHLLFRIGDICQINLVNAGSTAIKKWQKLCPIYLSLSQRQTIVAFSKRTHQMVVNDVLLQGT